MLTRFKMAKCLKTQFIDNGYVNSRVGYTVKSTIYTHYKPVSIHIREVCQ